MSDEPSATRGRLVPPAAAPSSAGNELTRLAEIMRLLRSPEGCPWDREQSLASLAPFVLEEAHEVVEAIERDDLDGLRGEVGDLVFEGVFLAQLASEQGAFTLADALGSVTEKLIRRHPHVFAQPGADAARPGADAAQAGADGTHPGADGTSGRAIDSPAAVKEQWDEIKAQERADAGKGGHGPMDGIPASLPALMTAHEIGRRAAKVRFDWPDAAGVLAKVEEELRELRTEMADGDRERTREELGDLLFSMANLARQLGVDPEAALRAANRKFLARFAALSERLARRGTRWDDVSVEEMEAEWQAVKTSMK